MMGTPVMLMFILIGCFQATCGMPTLEDAIRNLELAIDSRMGHHHEHPHSSSSEKSEEEQTPQGDFPVIPGPKKDDKIAIVGAGPSGVHMALLLKEAGYDNVIVFEKEDEVGGKSKTVLYRDTVQEEGTCYTQPDYTLLYTLMEELNLGELLPLPSPAVWFEPDRFTSTQYSLLPVAQSLPVNSSQEAIQDKFLKTVQEYIAVHIALFGKYIGELMPRPSEDILRDELNMTFLDFLTKHDVQTLKSLFLQAQTAQGYGHIDEIPALYGLTWMTPNFLLKLLNPSATEVTASKVLSRGYQTVWKGIVEQKGINVRLSSPVRGIKRRRREERGHGGHKGQEHGPAFEIRYDNAAGHRQTELFDFLVLTPELKLLSDLDIIEYNEQERELFEKMNRNYYTTTLVDTTYGTSRSTSPQVYYPDNIKGKQDGKVWVKRDSYNSLQYNTGENYTKGLFPGADDGRFDQTSIYYQFSKAQPNKEELEIELRKHITEREGAEVINILDVNIWNYFPQFSVADIASGIIWDIFDMQGRYGIWYLGSSAYFESAKSVMEYNELIMRQLDTPEPE